jgi:hypothetical protein
MQTQNKRRIRQQGLVRLIEQNANRQCWNECRKHLRALCREIGPEGARRYDPGALDNALTLLELLRKTGLVDERQGAIVHALHRRLVDYLVARSSPGIWAAIQAYLEAGVMGELLLAANRAPDGEPCCRLRDVWGVKVGNFFRNDVGIC